jgi:hypothetical protein
MGIREDINNAVAQVATNYGAAYVKDIKQQLSQKDKIASGSLYNSINYNVAIQDTGVHLQLLYNDYLQWIDAGRHPGTQPPVDSILQWIQSRAIAPNIYAKTRTNILGRYSKGFKLGRAKSGRFESILKAQTSLAWAIAKSIKKNGIKAVPILKDAADRLYGPMETAATNAAVEAAKATMNEEFVNQVRQAGLLITTTY